MAGAERRDSSWNDIGLLFDAYVTVGYLDAVSRVPAIKRAKAQLLDLLELRSGQRVLDAGCGTGEDVWSIADRVGPDGHAEGVDMNPWMIGEAGRRARARVGSVTPDMVTPTFTVGDIYALPYPDSHFDAARAERLFTHLTDPVAALREMARVVRPGGYVAVGDASFDTLSLAGLPVPITSLVCRRALERYPNGAVGGRLPEHFQEAGLEDVRTVPIEIAATTGAEAETLFSLVQTTDYLVETGLASAPEVTAWYERLAAVERRGELSWRILGNLVRGRVAGREASKHEPSARCALLRARAATTPSAPAPRRRRGSIARTAGPLPGRSAPT